jgi:hypothetical protein
MAYFYMEGDSLIWFQDVEKNSQFLTWEVFTRALQTRIRPAYDDPMEALTKLRQSSTVAEYSTQFEALLNRL